MSAPNVIDLATAREAARSRYDSVRHEGGSWREQDAALADLRAATIAAETRAERIARLNRRAADCDAQAERFMDEEASLAGRIAYCLQVPEGWSEPRNLDLAELLEGKRCAVVRCAASAMGEAFCARLDVSALVAEQELLTFLADTARGVGRA